MIDTPFGKMRVWDAHVHFFTRGFFAGLAKQVGVGPEDVVKQLGWERVGADPTEVGRRWVDELDQHGVDGAVGMHTWPGDVESAGRGIQATQGRLAGFVTINPLAGGAAAIVERMVSEFGFRGVALFPAMHGFGMSSEGVRPVLEIANRHGLCVFVHCGVLKVGFRKKLGLPSDFNGMMGNPLMLQKPAAEWPRAKFIVPHLGSGMLRELLMVGDCSPNIYTDTSGVGSWGKYTEERMSEAQVLRRVIDVLGAQRVLFGTDSSFFPRGWRRDVFDAQMKVFGEAGLGEEQVTGILSENLIRILGA